MNVRSLGYATDLLFTRFEGEVIDRGDYLVARTRDNPTFHWGNFLLFDGPPAEGDFDRWRELFAQEIGTMPGVGHVAFGWNSGEEGLIEPFLEAGYVLNDNVTLAGDAVHRPEKYCEEAEIRPLVEDWEWEAAMESKVEGRDLVFSEEGFRDFSNRQMTMRRSMVQSGLGQWFGAFIDRRLAGDLGVFVFDGLGRFQSVGTHPDFRRRGVCGALVYHAATQALERMGAERLVMVEPGHGLKVHSSDRARAAPSRPSNSADTS